MFEGGVGRGERRPVPGQLAGAAAEPEGGEGPEHGGPRRQRHRVPLRLPAQKELCRPRREVYEDGHL